MHDVVLTAVVVALVACGGKSSTPTIPAGPTDPAELAAFDNARPVFETHCARCHSRGGRLSTEKKRDHFDMTTYPFAGHHATEIAKEIRKALGIDGSKPTMPFDDKGAVKGDDLALIAAWADAFDAAHAHEGHGDHDHDH